MGEDVGIAADTPGVGAVAGEPPTRNRPERPAAASSTGRTSGFRLGNRPALTGVRAFLMFPVVAFHAGLTALQGAWMPLEFFFVLSGFLITSMLASEHRRTGRIRITTFYSRRAVRLVPPLVLTIALLGLYAAFVHVNNAPQRVWTDSAAALFYSDYRQAFETDPLYSGFLTQCWSLAVEEQFYIVWAALLVAAVRFGTRRMAYTICGIGILASLVDRLHVVLAAPQWTISVADRAYYSFDTRADALFIGCLLGLIATDGGLERWTPTARRIAAVAALVSTAVLMWVLFTVGVFDRTLPLFWIPVTELASVAIIVYFVVQPTGLGTRFVGLGVLVLLGDMTYTIYLLHWPIFVALSSSTVGWSPWVIQVVRFAILTPLVVASWYLIERPLMTWRRRALDPVRRAEEARKQPNGPDEPQPSATPPLQLRQGR